MKVNFRNVLVGICWVSGLIVALVQPLLPRPLNDDANFAIPILFLCGLAIALIHNKLNSGRMFPGRIGGDEGSAAEVPAWPRQRQIEEYLSYFICLLCGGVLTELLLTVLRV